MSCERNVEAVAILGQYMYMFMSLAYGLHTTINLCGKILCHQQGKGHSIQICDLILPFTIENNIEHSILF